METIATRVTKSRKNFARQTGALWGTTREATNRFARDTSTAAGKFSRATRKEGQGWLSYAAQRRQKLWEQKNLVKVDRTALERGLLVQLAQALDLLQARVAQRLTALVDADAHDPELPLGDYQSLTAKAIVAQLDELSPEQCREVYAFEEGHKSRATVLRALEQRLAA